MPRAGKVDAAARAARVVQLRALGIYSFEEIAKLVDPPYKSGSGAYEAYKRAIASEVTEATDEMRNNAVRRLDAIIRAHMPAALGAGGQDRDLKAAEIIMKADAERRKYFAGLEVPAEVNATVTNVTRDEFETWLQGAHAQWQLQQDRESQDA